ncbi:hypothetical protein BGX27_006869 [Mortierella sp. AM989]|nr:hypothetical protein BGX27_006869 [Mortierella sp. AM989]
MSTTRRATLPQAFRAIYKDDDSGATTPLSKTANINTRFDSRSSENVILWDDIKIAFNNALHVWHEDTIVPYLTDDNLNFLQPLRIPAYPGVVLDVAIEHPRNISSIELLSINDSSTTTSISPRYQSPTDTESTASTAPPPITAHDDRLNSRVKRAPEDRGESLHSSASPILVPIGRSPQFISNYNDHSNDFYNHTQPDVEDTSGSVSAGRQENIQNDERDINENYERGRAFYDGTGVLQDYPEAMACFLEAADHGHIDACYYLGLMYESGKGILRDYSKAVGWYEKAASQGYADAQFKLGDMYDNGYGVTRNKSKAVTWFQKAADQGHGRAQAHLGFMYQFGDGVTQDKFKAVEWYQKAAIQGHDDAQINLGDMYANGEGVARNKSKALEWYEKAAIQGNDEAQRLVQTYSKLFIEKVFDLFKY